VKRKLEGAPDFVMTAGLRARGIEKFAARLAGLTRIPLLVACCRSSRSGTPSPPQRVPVSSSPMIRERITPPATKGSAAAWNWRASWSECRTLARRLPDAVVGPLQNVLDVLEARYELLLYFIVIAAAIWACSPYLPASTSTASRRRSSRPCARHHEGW